MKEKTMIKTIDEAVQWDSSLTIVSKADLYGTIEYVNDVFAQVSGYQEYELMGKAHNIIRHPDMPKVIFKLMWENIKEGQKFHGIIKNLCKSGKYYWVITDFDYIIDDSAKIQKYIARRKAVSQAVIDKIEVLYKKLLQIEEMVGLEASEKYLVGFLEDLGFTYVQYVTHVMVEADTDNTNSIDTSLAQEQQTEYKENFFKKFFGIFS